MLNLFPSSTSTSKIPLCRFPDFYLSGRFNPIKNQVADLPIIFQKIFLFLFDQPAGDAVLQKAHKLLTDDAAIDIPSDEALLLSFQDQIQDFVVEHRYLIKGLALEKASVYAHLEHQDPGVLRIGFKKIEVEPGQLPYLIEDIMNPLEVKVQFLAERFRFLRRNGKEKIFLVLEVLVNRTLGDVRSLGDLRNAGTLEIAVAEDFNRCLENLPLSQIFLFCQGKSLFEINELCSLSVIDMYLSSCIY